ncbi:MAG: hypothetical protein DWQ10_14210 [Calditrichaeota bacterium]|nr:MAG: hypothetical protein DWQ10_14210 [Calditrichota bacterium]
MQDDAGYFKVRKVIALQIYQKEKKCQDLLKIIFSILECYIIRKQQLIKDVKFHLEIIFISTLQEKSMDNCP